VKDAAIKITINDLSHIGPEKGILLGKTLIIDLLQRFKMILNALIILRILRLAGPVGRRNAGHAILPFFIALFKAVVTVVK
jgi:hypothetical protein